MGMPALVAAISVVALVLFVLRSIKHWNKKMEDRQTLIENEIKRLRRKE